MRYGERRRLSIMSKGLNFAIRQIRTVLGDDADQPRFLETLPRRGYRFIAPLSDAGALEEVAVPASEPAPPAARPRFRWRLAISCVALGVVAAALIIGLNWDHLRRRWRPWLSGQRIESLAVLPLHNLSHDSEQEYFSDGMTDQLITDLAKFGGLRVISHTSVERYKGTRQRLPEIARELRCGCGGRRDGDALRRQSPDHRPAHRCAQRHPPVG